MYELYPYFTNDGTVGLFSRRDDDIYHSTYGAVTESWQKFIIPSRLEKYLQEHESVKILDICYGIGYNTKTALNVFINNANKNSKKKFNTKNYKKYSKKCSSVNHNIAAIDSDNILDENTISFSEKNINSQLINKENTINNIASIDSNNINGNESSFSYENIVDGKVFSKNMCDNSNTSQSCNKITIDAVDMDKFLMDISPFITDASWFKFMFEKKMNNEPIALQNKIKYQQIKNIKNFKKFIRKEYRLKQEVSLIILQELFNSNPELFKDKILQSILSQRRYSQFFSKFMLNFAKFYSNLACKHNLKANKSTYLHNIYYRYISRSYKTVQKLRNLCQIKLNFYKNDARSFIKASDTKYNFIFLDAFTPSKCPALWTVEFFAQLYSRLEDDGMILTYSNSAAIRSAFLKNGFFVGKTYDANSKKFVGTVAVKNKNLIEHELDNKDLDLINSKAGICYSDKFLEADNQTIIKDREIEVENSDLVSSTKILKGYKNDHSKSL